MKKGKMLGTDEKPTMTFRKSIYGKSSEWGGKGAKPRAFAYTKEYKDNFERIFGEHKSSKSSSDQISVRGFSGALYTIQYLKSPAFNNNRE